MLSAHPGSVTPPPPFRVNPGARCSSGQLSLEPGYWSERATDVANVTSETIFIQCLFVDACLAVDNGTRHECRFPNRGYDNLATRRGALATHASCVLRVVLGSRLCALCEDGHTTFGGGCVACPAPGANVAIVVALAAMVVAGLSYLVFRKPVDKARSASAGVVRIGINFFQLVRRPLMWLWWWFRCSGGGAVVAADGGRAGSVDTLVLYLCWYCIYAGTVPHVASASTCCRTLVLALFACTRAHSCSSTWTSGASQRRRHCTLPRETSSHTRPRLFVQQ